MRQRFQLLIPTSVPLVEADGTVNQYRQVPGPLEAMEFELDIDLDAIKKRLGRSAARAKTKRSQEMSGLIVVRRVK